MLTVLDKIKNPHKFLGNNENLWGEFDLAEGNQINFCFFLFGKTSIV